MSLRLIDEINVQYEKHIRREGDEYDKKQEILNMKLSHNNQFLAVMIGHHLVQDESENSLLILYQLKLDKWKIIR